MAVDDENKDAVVGGESSEAGHQRSETDPALPITESELEDVAETEHEYLHERLREELGREPSEAELDEWLRQHTEGY